MISDAPKAARLLVVDDEVDTCENLCDIFTDLGYQVDAAHDGPAALKLVGAHAYDVALLDLKMPGMSGLELYREIRNISASTVAIVVTAYASSDTAKAVLAAGAWRIVSKPVDFSQVQQLVDSAIDQPLVLVVDDDQELCESLWDLLREHGYRVGIAHDAREAGTFLKRHEYQVVLIDMKLPGVDSGVSVLQAVRSQNPDARTVVITGFALEMNALVDRALQGGASAVCYKPFDVGQLLRTVDQLARHSSERG